MKTHRPSDEPFPKKCPYCGSYAEFSIKNIGKNKSPTEISLKCVHCGKYFYLDEGNKASDKKR